MYRIYVSLFFICIALFFSPISYAGKKQCQPYLDKLRNIQAQQRQGHSLKRGESLNKREAKVRKKWWQCERGLLKTAKSRNKKKPKKVKLAKHQTIASYSPVSTTSVKLSPFKTSTVVVKSRYQGKQLQAWLKYYQQPKKCARPKTTKQFAFCVEDRGIQQVHFEKEMIQ